MTEIDQLVAEQTNCRIMFMIRPATLVVAGINENKKTLAVIRLAPAGIRLRRNKATNEYKEKSR